MKKNSKILVRFFASGLMMLTLIFYSYNSYAQSSGLSLEEKMTSLKQVIEKVEKLSGYNFLYNAQLIDVTKKISISKKDVSLKVLLDEVFKDSDISYKIVDKQIILSTKSSKDRISEQKKPSGSALSKNGEKVIRGKVVDENGRPIPGVSILVKGTSKGTSTNIDGAFTLAVPEGDKFLTASFIGYSPIEFALTSSDTYQLELKPNSKRLDEVVVTGYQTLKKYNTTGSVKILDSKAIDLKSNLGMDKMLEGAVPGLVVYKGDYRIRGGSSLNAGTRPLFIVDDFEVESLPANMDMVESITVLKDAAAAAIWGSRASNGVIVITTKQGKNNDFKISYSNNFNISAEPNFDDLHRADSPTLLSYQKEAYQKEYIYPMIYEGSDYGYPESYQIFFDHYNKIIDNNEMDRRLAELGKLSNKQQIKDNLLRKAFNQSHFLSISGGTDKVNYLVSGSFTGGHSEYKGDDSKSSNINSRSSYKLTPYLKLRTDISATFGTSDSGYGGLSSSIYGLFPFQMLLDQQGEYIYDYSDFNKEQAQKLKGMGFLESGKNILEEAKLASSKGTNTDYKVRVGSDIKILEGLNLSVDYQYEKSGSEYKSITSKNAYDARTLFNRMTSIETGNVLKQNLPYGDILDKSNSATRAWIFKTGATLNRTFGVNNQHYVNAVVGFEVRRREYESASSRKLGYDDQLLTWQTFDQKALATTGIKWWDGETNNYYAEGYDGFSYQDNREKSSFGSAVYTYDNRYTLSGTLRFDESNLFGADEKFRRNPIWSVGANWNIANESFFKVKAIDALTLRTSYGLTGNFDRSGMTTPIMTARKLYMSSVGGYVTRIVSPPNPKLRWEKTKVFNLSLDFSLWNRLNGSIDYYNNYCYDLLGNSILDPTVGYSSARINAADMRNKGIEFSINGDIVRSNGFTWFAGFVFTHNSNKILNNKVSDGAPEYNRPSGSSGFVEGYPREAIWSYKWAGLDGSGNPQTYDENGNKTSKVISLASIECNGTYTPKYNGSFNTGISYMGIQLSCMFIYNYGQVFRTEYPSMNPYENSPSTSELIAKRWMKPGDENTTDIPSIWTPDWSNYLQYRDVLATRSSNSIRKGGFVRLREVALNYQFPKRLLQKTPFKNISLLAQANNLALWTQNKESYDPEAVDAKSGRFSLRQPVSYTFGVKLDF